MPDIFFEDIVPGAVSTFGRHEVDRDAMLAFAREFDDQPFHTDPEAAKAAPIGRLIASGWYSAALQMRLMCEAWFGRAASLGGPGIEELRWIRPVEAGDVLSVRQTILETRASRSKPGLGIVRFRLELLKQDGGPAMDMIHLGLLGLRGGTLRHVAEPPPDLGRAPSAFAPAEDPVEAPRFYDDIEIGRAVDLGGHLFTADRIVSFAREFDPQAFHLDEQAAAAGPFRGLAASGWHTGAAWMRLFSARLNRMEAAGGRPRISVSPGIRDLRWLRPVYAGETIRYATEPIAKRPLGSRPGWGVLTSRNSGRNGRGETVFEFVGNAFWEMRSRTA